MPMYRQWDFVSVRGRPVACVCVCPLAIGDSIRFRASFPAGSSAICIRVCICSTERASERTSERELSRFACVEEVLWLPQPQPPPPPLLLLSMLGPFVRRRRQRQPTITMGPDLGSFVCPSSRARGSVIVWLLLLLVQWISSA